MATIIPASEIMGDAAGGLYLGAEDKARGSIFGITASHSLQRDHCKAPAGIEPATLNHLAPTLAYPQAYSWHCTPSRRRSPLSVHCPGG